MESYIQYESANIPICKPVLIKAYEFVCTKNYGYRYFLSVI